MCLFNLGSVVATPPAIRLCARHNVNPADLIQRHCSGDWGDLDANDVKANVQAVQHDLRILSAYKIGDSKVYVITEADRSSTCLLLAEEY